MHVFFFHVFADDEDGEAELAALMNVENTAKGLVGGPVIQVVGGPVAHVVAVLEPPPTRTIHRGFVAWRHSEPVGPLDIGIMGFRVATVQGDYCGHSFYNLLVPHPTLPHESDRPGPVLDLADYDHPLCLHMVNMEFGLMGHPHCPPGLPPAKINILNISCGELADINMGSDVVYFRRLLLMRNGVWDEGWDRRWSFGGYM